jgi:hypothetical protein
MDRSLLKLTEFVFVLRNDYSKVFRNGVNIVELKSEIFGSQGYIERRSTISLVLVTKRRKNLRPRSYRTSNAVAHSSSYFHNKKHTN